MVYFVGRDVNLYVGTEEAANALLWSGSTTGPNWNTTNNTLWICTDTVAGTP